jgi:acetyl esterase/lipase
MRTLEDKAFLECLRTELIEPDVLPEGVRLEENVEFGSINDRKLLLDAYDVETIPGKARPAMVFLHGGAWKFGSPKQFLRQSGYLAKRHNIYCVSVDYRLSEEARFPAALQDAKCAVRYVRSRSSELNINPDRVGVCGGSAGGHLAAMVAATEGVPEYEGEGGWQEFSSRCDLAIFLNGEFDLWDFVRNQELLGAIELFFGCSAEENPVLYDQASPIKRFHANMPPCLFQHGDADTCVSYQQSVDAHARLVELGIPAEIEIYPGKQHAWFNRAPDFLPVLERMEEFIRKHFHL